MGNRNTLITVLMVVFGAIGFVSIVHDATERDYRDGVQTGIVLGETKCNNDFIAGYNIGIGLVKVKAGTIFTPCMVRGYEEGLKAKADADRIDRLTERNNDLRAANDRLSGRVDKLERLIGRNGPTIIVVTPPAERPTEATRPAYCNSMTAADAGWLSQTGRKYLVDACLAG